MKSRAMWIAWLAAVGIWGVAAAVAQESPHKITAQEVAEMLADPSATITYFNVNYRAYLDVGPQDDLNQEMRLNGAGFLRLPDNSSVLYRAYLPLYATEVVAPYEPPAALGAGAGAAENRAAGAAGAPAVPSWVMDPRFCDQGMGDALISAYWVPGRGSLILGYGGALIVPTASEDYYGLDKWCAGPTLVVARKVPGKYTVGGLLTHVWSFEGDDERADVSLSTIQPAVTVFLNKKGTSVICGSETTYNWNADQDAWQIPVSIGLGQVLPPIGKEFIGVALAASYYVEKADGVQDWDVRATLSVVFP